MIFRDRYEAGDKLAEQLQIYKGEDGIVLAIPRGGVEVGSQVAKALDFELDIIIPRKIGEPGNPEVAIGAVTQDGTTIFDRRLLDFLGLTEEDLAESVAAEREEIVRRRTLYRGNAPKRDLSGRVVAVVDDGIATGYTMLAALKSISKAKPSELILAVPVAAPETLEMLRGEVDKVICLHAPENFYAVGQFYKVFPQTKDQEVIELLGMVRK